MPFRFVSFWVDWIGRIRFWLVGWFAIAAGKKKTEERERKNLPVVQIKKELKEKQKDKGKRRQNSFESTKILEVEVFYHFTFFSFFISK